MPPRRSAAVAATTPTKAKPLRSSRSSRSAVSVTDWSTTQDEFVPISFCIATSDDPIRERAVSISSDSTLEIIPAKKTAKGSNKIVRKPKAKEESDDEIVLVRKVVKREVKRDGSDDSVMLIDDEDTKAKVREGSPTKRSTAKVRPPTPGTSEYEKLEPITFAKDYAAKGGQVSKESAKRVKVTSLTGSPEYRKVPSVVVSRPVKRLQKQSAIIASAKRKRLIESSDEEVLDDSGSQNSDDESENPKPVRHHKKNPMSNDDEDDEEEAEDHESSGQEVSNSDSDEEESESGVTERSDPFIDNQSSMQIRKGVGKGKVVTSDKGKHKAKEETKPVEKPKNIVIDKGKDKVTQINENTVYWEDVMKSRFVRDKNEHPKFAVMKDAHQDYVIAETYENLPWLKWGELLPWAEDTRIDAPSLVWFQIWQEVLNPYDEAYLFKWLTFQQSGRYVNMSRSDPEKVTVSNFGTQRFLVLPGTGTHCICVSLILVNSCSLVYGRPIGETRNKKIGGVLHIQEHERLASHFCMQYDLVSDLNANAYGWVLYFNTRNEDFGTKFKQNSPVKEAKPTGPAPTSPGFSFFSKYPGMAPRVQQRSTPTKTADAEFSASPSKPTGRQKPFKPVLDYHDTVPIYDGRKPEFDPLLDLDKLENLPLWPGEAPKNSLAAVGYTAHTYWTKAGQVHLSFNVQWLVLLGVSDVVDF